MSYRGTKRDVPWELKERFEKAHKKWEEHRNSWIQLDAERRREAFLDLIEVSMEVIEADREKKAKSSRRRTG